MVVVVVVVFLEVLGVLLVVLRSEPLVPVGVALMPARPSRLLLVVVLLLLSVVPPISAEDDEDEEGAVMTTDVLGVVVFSSADPVFATVRRGSTFVVTGLDRAAVEEKDCAPPRSFRGGSGCSVLLLREEEEDGKTAADISNGLVRLTAPHDRNVPSSSSTTHIVFVVIVIVISTVVAYRWVLLCCYSIRFDSIRFGDVI